jgi:ABC-type uncharacterized transport system fused permease/ATPase subunit
MGEQQALGFIRAMFHKPSWAVLDECTSAMAEDMAEVCYKILEDSGVSVVSISQSAEALLRPYHAQELRLGEANESGWSLRDLNLRVDSTPAATVVASPSRARGNDNELMPVPSPPHEPPLD